MRGFRSDVSASSNSTYYYVREALNLGGEVAHVEVLRRVSGPCCSLLLAQCYLSEGEGVSNTCSSIVTSVWLRSPRPV